MIQGEEYQQPITSRSGSSLDLVSLTHPNPESNLIKVKIPVLGLDIVERQV